MMKTSKKLLHKTAKFLSKKDTKTGRIIWFLNGSMLVFYYEFILKTLLSPYGLLDDFVGGAIAVITIVTIPTYIYYTNFRIFRFLNSLSIIDHVIISLILSITYYFSIKKLWTNKERYVQ